MGLRDLGVGKFLPELHPVSLAADGLIHGGGVLGILGNRGHSSEYEYR